MHTMLIIQRVVLPAIVNALFVENIETAHVAEAVGSLMNPSGASTAIDPVNMGIVSMTRNRRFGPGDLKRNLLDHVETLDLIDAYVKALDVNRVLRREGLEKADRAAVNSRYIAKNIADEALQLDDHLAEVALLVCNLYESESFYARAADYSDLAAYLFGIETARGRDLLARSNSLRWRSSKVYGSTDPELNPSPTPTQSEPR